MIDWSEVEKKIKTISIFETFKAHIDLEELATIKEHHEQMNENSLIQTKLFEKIETLGMSASENSLFLLLVILYLTEGPISLAINIFIYTLMLRGHHDIWFEEKQKFVSSFDELFSVSLSVKLKFLKKHGFGFMPEICSREIRNAVAHQDFKIEPDGTVYTMKDGKIYSKFTKKDLTEKIENALRLIELLAEIK